MAINTLATATLFMTQLDKIAVQEATTGWMDANAGQVIYNGGSEVKIPKMSVQGMGDYDREAGYQRGSVTLEYETRKMTQDRGRLFQLDPMDINEANFIPTAGAVMGEFQRTQVVPEIDAYRISKLATETLTADKAGMIGESYVPGATGTSALRKFKEGIKAVRDSYNGALICQATPEFIMELELELAGKIENTTFSKGGIDTRVPAVDIKIVEEFSAGESKDHSSMCINGSFMADGESIKIYNAKHVTSGGHLVFDSDGSTVAYLSSSAKRYKNHLSNMTLDEAEKILDIPVVWFNYKEGYLAEDDQMNGKPVPGMYAEDVAKYYPVGAYNNEEGLVENWNERMIIPAMLKLLQNLYKRIS